MKQDEPQFFQISAAPEMRAKRACQASYEVESEGLYTVDKKHGLKYSYAWPSWKMLLWAVVCGPLGGPSGVSQTLSETFSCTGKSSEGESRRAHRNSSALSAQPRLRTFATLERETTKGGSQPCARG